MMRKSLQSEESDPSRVSIVEIARAIGCAPSTVSRALRDDPRISDAMRERIRQKARGMGYRPHPFVAALMSYVRDRRHAPGRATLAWVDHHAADDPDVIAACKPYELAARLRARELGYRMDSFWIHEPDLGVLRLQQVLRARNIRGLVFAPFTFARETWGNAFDWEHLAAVVLGRTPQHPPIHHVARDSLHEIDLLMQRLQEFGYRRIGFAVSSRMEELSCNQWGAQFWRHAQVGRACEVLPCFFHAGLGPEVEAAFRRWFAENSPDVLLCGSVVFRTWLARMGLSVPRDVGLAEIDVTSDPRTADWAGVAVNVEGLSAAAVDLVAAQLQNNEYGLPRFQKLVLIPGRFVEGKTLRHP
jgi:LacI family transcriptional regulator